MKKILTGIALLVFLLSTAPFAFADQAANSFEAPVTRVDNTVLLLEEIDGFDIKLDGVILKSQEMTPPTDYIYSLSGTSRSFKVETLPGDHVINIVTVDTEGRRSADGVDIFFAAKAEPSAITKVGSVKVTVTVEVPLP